MLKSFAKYTILSFCFAVSADYSYGEVTCKIADAKKTIVADLLCGRLAQGPDAEYRADGPGCFQKSVTKRLEDSALHVLVFQLCNDEEFAARLEKANLKVLRFMGDLGSCIGEPLDLAKIQEESTQRVRQSLQVASCTSQYRGLIQRRKADFDRMIAISESVDAEIFFSEKLMIQRDSQGNLIDR